MGRTGERIEDIPDEALMARAQAGDEGAFEALLDRHAAFLRVAVRRRLPAALSRKVSVSDILQETRIVALERRAEFVPRGEEPVRRWLDRIAEMKVRDALKHYAKAGMRSVRREVSRGARPDTKAFAARGPSPSEAAIASETLALVRKALGELPEDYRTVLRLAREEKLTLREIAERMGRSREAAKKLYARAHARLAREYGRLRGGS